MSEPVWKPRVTVAAVIERDGHHLLVRETVAGRPCLNQPAGHLEPGESLLEAVVREVREETARAFTPTGLVGIYLWRADPGRDTFLRVTFSGEVGEPLPGLALDLDIDGTEWLGAAEIEARAADCRSPLVLAAIRDHAAGRRYPLDLLKTLLDPATS